MVLYGATVVVFEQNQAIHVIYAKSCVRRNDVYEANDRHVAVARPCYRRNVLVIGLYALCKAQHNSISSATDRSTPTTDTVDIHKLRQTDRPTHVDR